VTTNGALNGLSGEDLRTLVREVLRDVLPATSADVPTGERTGPVSLRTDQDLQAFVRQVAALCEDAEVRGQLRDGRRSFHLAPDGTGSADGSLATGIPAPVRAGPSVTRVERGAVTERVVARAAADGARLVLGPRAVVTPLARDKARLLGVRIEKEC
jgi:hypothetical protein